ncbi:beta-ketoacyl-[acyl-carrier-protein] synthase family protein [Corallincola platygyrae]|uniref:Beta-ketoacyl-[acyl-carrier-protein] synthase family protein n=1 Tax=Corallincola platygyrae TaxID=1193278 RepID=A0ABW4XJ04_9GAMM
MSEKLYINAMGVTCPLGDSPEKISQRLFSGDRSALQPSDQLISGRQTYLGRVSVELSQLPRVLADYECRNSRLLFHSYQQIADKVTELKRRYGASRIGVVLGSSTAGIAEGEQALIEVAEQGKFPESYHYLKQELGSVAEFIAKAAGVKGPVYTVSTACSSSGKVLASAWRLVQADLCDVVICGGGDSLCELTVNGFDALESVSTELGNPFSVNRSGINIGEASALFVVSKEPAPLALLGVGESSDAYHISAPEPSGAGAERAIMAALEQARLAPEQIGYLNLHGTGTPKNDEMESRVVNRVFGVELPCSSTKALTGHTLGAAGALELAFCCLTLDVSNTAGLLPPHVWDGESDPGLAQINLASPESRLTKVICMTNNFAFGGSNVSLIVGREA